MNRNIHTRNEILRTDYDFGICSMMLYNRKVTIKSILEINRRDPKTI